LPTSTLGYDGKCDLELVVDIHGTTVPVTARIDTGFVSDTGFGLRLPINLTGHAKYVGTGSVRVADGRLVNADSIPDAEILEIEGHKLAKPVSTPAIFMDGPCGLLGVLFLQRCMIKLDGPNKKAEITF
jgi:hypothetical protein